MSDFSSRKQEIRDLFDGITARNFGFYDYWFSYLEEAVYCYLEERNIACILTSSATVETLLFWKYLEINKESIVLKLRQPTKEKGEEKPPRGAVSYRTLAKIERIDSLAKLFDKLRNTELPLELLLGGNEMACFKKLDGLGDETRMRSISRFEFISIRNEFAHGSIFDVVAKLTSERFLRTSSTFKVFATTSKELEQIAYRQLHKCLIFTKGLPNKRTARTRVQR